MITVINNMVNNDDNRKKSNKNPEPIRLDCDRSKLVSVTGHCAAKVLKVQKLTLYLPKLLHCSLTLPFRECE